MVIDECFVAWSEKLTNQVDDTQEVVPPLPPVETGGTVDSSIDESDGRPARSGCLGFVAGVGGCAVLVVVIIGALIALGVTSVNSVIGGIGGLFGVGTSAPPPVANVISSRTLVQGIQPLGQLVSVSSQLAKADVYVGVGQGALNACGFSANHVVQGAVEAGVDLTQIREENIRYDEARDTYIVTVPAPQLTSCRVDFIRQYDRSFTTCAVDWDEARLLANYEALIDFRDDAIEGGILTRAETETRLVLGNFVRLLTGKQVEIVFEQAAEAAYPVSCTPDVPQGWRFVPENNHWTK